MMSRIFKVFYLIAVVFATVQVTATEEVKEDTHSKVLIIEDNLGILRDTEKALANKHNIRLAVNVEEGLIAWRSFQPDIVILDMHMPMNSSEEEPNIRAGLILLRNAPKDKAKVILASAAFRLLEVIPLIDYNFRGKVSWSVDDKIHRVIEQLLRSEEPPNRVGVTVKQNEEAIEQSREAVKQTEKLVKQTTVFARLMQKCMVLFSKR